MPLLLKFTVLSAFLIAASVTNSEEKDLEADVFAVTDSDLKGDVGAFDDDDPEIDVDDLESDDHVKRYANETVAIVGHGRITSSWYRSKRMRKPDDDEDIISKYYKRRRRPDYDDEDGSITDDNERRGRPDYDDEDGSRPDDNERRRPDYDDEEGSITDDNERRGRPDYDEDRRRPNDNRRRRNRINFGDSCQTCGKMLGRKRGMSWYLERVINGRAVQPVYKYPWIVSLREPSVGIFCGGAIISATYILTAGHCVVNPNKEKFPQCKRIGVLPKFCYFKPNEITINFLGRRQNDRQKPVRIAQLIPHDQFDYGKVLHDIALVKLAAPIQCNQFSSPICLPTTDLQKLGGKFIIAGWGYNTEEGQNGPQLLREGTMKQVQANVCRKLTQPFFNNPADIVCGVGTQSGQSSCMGDSGSSIFAPFGNKVYTIGISSRHSTPNCQINMPVTYAKVFRYINWIKRHVRDLPGSQG